ncbi:putative NAD-dependent epimerase/dehydratase [Sodiomyces alkalinus F11]|uniref:Putative NAD-dependent epimerase/dehydratase n=1 Tax=Sodiomyces alkalinus (strain CBS 110278 / VKM F-3762 / F11) TaxID=1314773 RepID=A0A3N2PJJ3_SODAK|nr:putative NAD-dependent epimerase/dehydratase [Sodiomyces alkalinus F11]ROT34554.1 putative NAD-dependent epimerase/dehydratase [Sodiomyces alkalinus F11]
MVSYAILGGTGNCGSGLIQNLLRSSDADINVYCRNEAKLYAMLPETANNKRVKVFAGSIQDVKLMENCIRGTKAVFMTVTTNDNIPGCSLSQDTASSVIQALQNIRAASPDTFMAPKMVLLSSATIDDHLARHMPFWFRPIMLTAASHVYRDLRLAEEYLRRQEDWVTTIYIKPGGLSLDIQRGHQLNFDEEESFISYLDLSAAMIEAADDEQGQYDNRNVSVVNKKRGQGAKFPRGTPKCIMVGLCRHFFPFAHNWLPKTGPA